VLGLPGGAGMGGTTKGVKSKSLGFLDVSEGCPGCPGLAFPEVLTRAKRQINRGSINSPN